MFKMVLNHLKLFVKNSYFIKLELNSFFYSQNKAPRYKTALTIILPSFKCFKTS